MRSPGQSHHKVYVVRSARFDSIEEGKSTLIGSSYEAVAASSAGRHPHLGLRGGWRQVFGTLRPEHLRLRHEHLPDDGQACHGEDKTEEANDI